MRKTVVLKVRDELRISLKGQSYESLLQNQKSFVNFGLSKGGEGRELCTSFVDLQYLLLLVLTYIFKPDSPLRDISSNMIMIIRLLVKYEWGHA
jgi:hypothetical protein